jgi:D-glycero-D-manno-heptose 1,7-bisphosphate phosphatase
VTAHPRNHRVVILDRDGTIIVDRHYLDDPAAVEFIPGAGAALQSLYRGGYRLVIISNQSGVGRGLFDVERVHAVNEQLIRMIEALGARIEGIYFCPHAPGDGCDCRKPAPGLLEQAAAALGFDPSQSIVIGDKASDVAFGRRAGATTIRIAADAAGCEPGEKPDFVVADLAQAARILLDNSRGREG